MTELPVDIRSIEPGDADTWLRLRHALWPDEAEAEHRSEIERFFAGLAREPLAVLLAEDAAGRAVGLAELSIRSYAEGCSTDRVAFLEGWYVVPEARGRGVGGALVKATEDWGRAQGCSEYPNGLGEGTPGQAFSADQSRRAIDFAAAIVDAAAGSIAV